MRRALLVPYAPVDNNGRWPAPRQGFFREGKSDGVLLARQVATPYFLAELRRHVGFFLTVAFWALPSMARSNKIARRAPESSRRLAPLARLWQATAILIRAGGARRRIEDR
jgi:hypothetical protein